MRITESDKSSGENPAVELARIRKELEPLVERAEREIRPEDKGELPTNDLREKILELSVGYLDLEIAVAGGYQEWLDAGGASEFADRTGAVIGNEDCVRRLWKKRPDLKYLEHTFWYRKKRPLENK